MSSYIVAGGGFKGLIAAYLLAEKGHDVSLVEKSTKVGGIMRSVAWDEFFVDNGVHLFDSIPKNLAAIVEDVMDGDVLPIDFNYASVYNDVTTDGLAIPDFENIPRGLQEKILFEVVRQATVEEPSQSSSAYQLMCTRYGSTAADLMSASMAHIYGIEAEQVEADALRQTSYHRIKFLPDAMALELKKNPILDNRIAAKRVAVGKVDDFVSLYPSKNGMLGFCNAMHARLEKMGVTFYLGEGIEHVDIKPGKGCEVQLNATQLKADHLFWGNDHALLAKTWKQDERIAQLTHPTPMAVYYFKVDAERVNNYTYFHQFTPDRLVFRSAAAGQYSGQVNDEGLSFVSAECPTTIGSDMWKNPESKARAVWAECVSMGLLKPESTYVDAPLIRKAPVTHRFPKVGQFDLCDQLDHDIRETQGVVIMPRKEAFTRREIMFAVEDAIGTL